MFFFLTMQTAACKITRRLSNYDDGPVTEHEMHMGPNWGNGKKEFMRVLVMFGAIYMENIFK